MDSKFRKLLTRSTLILIWIILWPGLLPAQIEDFEEDMLGEEVQCQPDSFNTVYDKFKMDSVSGQQIAIWYSLAQEEYKYDNFKRALPYFWRVLMNDNTDKFRIVYSKIANCYFRLNQIDSTLLVSYMGLAKHPDYEQLHYWAGLVQDKRGNTLCAIPHYENLVGISSNKKEYWSKLAELYDRDNDERSVEAQQKVVDLDPGDVEAQKLLAILTSKYGGDPLKVLKDAWELDKTNVETAFRYGKESFEVGKYEEAIEPFKAILVTDSRHINAMEYLGRSYEAVGQTNQAIRYYNDILKIEPRSINVICLIASIYARQNNFTGARSYVQKAHRIDPGHGLPFMIMGEIYENSVNYCANKRKKRETTYDDKLVYRMATEEYTKAARDPNYAADANRRQEQLKNANLMPTTEDYFMHNNRLNPKEDCYSWIK